MLLVEGVNGSVGDSSTVELTEEGGGDPRRFTYSIRLVAKHIYKKNIVKSVEIQ